MFPWPLFFAPWPADVSGHIPRSGVNGAFGGNGYGSGGSQGSDGEGLSFTEGGGDNDDEYGYGETIGNDNDLSNGLCASSGKKKKKKKRY